MALLNNITDGMVKSEKYMNKSRSSRYGRVTSANSDGTVNAQDSSSLECRGVKLVCPQGISYSPLESSSGQMIENDGSPSMIGVYDPDRPVARPGEIILYSGGATISIYNGEINITGTVKVNGTQIP